MAADQGGIGTEGTGNAEGGLCPMAPAKGESSSRTCSARGTYKFAHCEQFGSPLGATLDSGVQPEATEVCREGQRDRLGRIHARPRVRAMDCNGSLSREDARRGEWDVRPPLSVFSVCFCSESHCQLKLSPPSGGSGRESSVEPPQSTL
jgi:hypothetical protein